MTQTIIEKKVERNIPVAHDLVVLHLKDDTNLNRKSLAIEEVGHVKDKVDHVKEGIDLGIEEVGHVIEEVDHVIEEVDHAIEEVDHAVEEADLVRKSLVIVVEIIAEVYQDLCHEIDHIEEKTQSPLKKRQEKTSRKTLRTR